MSGKDSQIFVGLVHGSEMNLITPSKREWKNLTMKNFDDKALRLTCLTTSIDMIEKLASRRLRNEATPPPRIWTRVVLGAHS